MALALGRDVQELPPVLGFSRASLFAYRTGKARITTKAWAKLKAAELEAGIDGEEEETPGSSRVKEDTAPVYVSPRELLARLDRMEAQLARIEAAVTRGGFGLD